MDATEIAQRVLLGELSSREVVEAALREIAYSNPVLNAVVETYERYAEQAAATSKRGPLHGVPFLLKDLGSACKGTRTTYGSKLFADVPYWRHDSVFVAKLKEAGGIVLGRTNTAEFGISLETEPMAYGSTVNPIHAGGSVGGSSGGSAAAVASGMVPFAHATDGCGSIRVPSARCGLFGLKPSRGRVSFAPDAGEGWAGMSCVGVIARSLRDSALLLDIVRGSHPGDPCGLGEPARGYVAETREFDRELRIGVLRSTHQRGSIDKDCLAALELGVDVCRARGYQIFDLKWSASVDHWIEIFIPIWACQLWSIVQARYRNIGAKPDGSCIEPVSWDLACRALRASAADYFQAVRQLHAESRRLAEAFRHYDIIMSPVAASAEVPIGFLANVKTCIEEYLYALFLEYPFAVPFNITGQPAMTVPLELDGHERPIGVQFAAQYGEEGRLFRLANAIDQDVNWSKGVFHRTMSGRSVC